MPRVYRATTARTGTIASQTMPPRRTLVALPGVRYWRIRRSLLQRQLADLAGVNITSVQRIEAGGQAGLETTSKLAEALEVEPAQLMAQPPEAS